MSAAAKIEIRDATLDDAETLAPLLRSIDLKEIVAMSGRSARAVLRSGIKTGEYTKVAFVDDEPVCIFGIVRNGAFSDEGTIWMLGTDAVEKNSIRFLRNCREQVEKMTKGFRRVSNFCHAENKTTLKWLEWLGFAVLDARPAGRHEDMFHLFFMENNNNV